MGRGRKGVLKQSNKAKATGGLRGRRGDPPGIFLSGPKPEDNKVLINEDSLAFMKTWINKSLSIFFCLTTGTSKHHSSMRLGVDSVK